MAGELLLDTGALVSILDRSQVHHEKYVRFFDEWDGPVVSTEAVLTEATHLLGRVRHGRKACYADLPMDYADATLVVLAEEIGTDLLFTTDRRDFRVYRIRGRKGFRIVPE